MGSSAGPKGLLRERAGGVYGFRDGRRKKRVKPVREI